jgi:histone acetyltransferase (RNA polymerase elongator complex component)
LCYWILRLNHLNFVVERERESVLPKKTKAIRIAPDYSLPLTHKTNKESNIRKCSKQNLSSRNQSKKEEEISCPDHQYIQIAQKSILSDILLTFSPT